MNPTSIANGIIVDVVVDGTSTICITDAPQEVFSKLHKSNMSYENFRFALEKAGYRVDKFRPIHQWTFKS